MFHESDLDWVMLGECDSEQELMVVRGLLESEGIECFCPIISSRYEGRTVEGGIPLQVRQADLEKARAILDATPEFSASDFPQADDDDEDV